MDGTGPNLTVQTASLPGGTVSLRVWSNPGKPRLAFLHANGFCASAYRQVFEKLAGDYEIWAPDLRGHGATTLPADAGMHRSWGIYVTDMMALWGQLGFVPDAMAGHSMGATTALMTAARLAREGRTIPALALIEPVILPRPVYWLARSPVFALNRNRMPIARQARRRRNGWPDREAARLRYAKHPGFARWAPGVLEDYLEGGLKAAGEGAGNGNRGGEGKVILACDPAWEAANYEAQAHNPDAAARLVAGRAHVLQAGHGSTLMRPRALTRYGARLTRMDDLGHLAPMQAPDRIAAWLSGALAGEEG